MDDWINITGGKIVLPHEVIEGRTLVVRNGRVQDIAPAGPAAASDVHVDGAWIIPGLIDTHNDALETEIKPRSGSHFQIGLAFRELERKLVTQGITTVYHSLSMMEENISNWVRRNDTVLEMIRSIRKLRAQRRMIRHSVHLRYEIANLNAIPVVKELLSRREVELLSFTDHTPGQGQWRDWETHKAFTVQKQRVSEAEAEQLLAARKNVPKPSRTELRDIAEQAYRARIPLASHDDDSLEKLTFATACHAAISEFPIALEVALEAKRRGLFVTMGAPNILLGRSHSHNLSAKEAIRAGAVDILCSDYYPASLLHAVFQLIDEGMTAPAAVNMATLHPARALGLEQAGSLEPGKRADLLVVRMQEGRPCIEKVFVEGIMVCDMKYALSN